MCLISNDLVRNRKNALLYYQLDKLWKKMEMSPEQQISHDVFENTWLSFKTTKNHPFLSTRYGKERIETWRKPRVEARMFMKTNVLATETDFTFFVSH